MTLLNPREVAEILGISERTIHQLCREGKLGYCQVDAKHRRFTQEHVVVYLRSVSVHTKVRNRGRNSQAMDMLYERVLAESETADLASLRQRISDLRKEP
jgi:excisionase family DNA binding protein